MSSINPLFAVRSAVLGRVRAWTVESQQGARRNAMIANTAMAARRAERQDVDAYFGVAPRASAAAAPAPSSRCSRLRATRAAATHRERPPSLRQNRPMPTSAARVAPAPSIAYHDVLSDDGTRLTAWTNDPDGTIDGPTVVLCNGLGTGPWAWPALLRPDCGVRIISWNHRGTGGSDRPGGPGPLRHRGVRRGRALGDGPLRRRPGAGHGLVHGRQHDVRAGLPPPRAGVRAVRGRGSAR